MLDSKQILTDFQASVQPKLDEYAQQGYQLSSTNTVSFGSAVYIYLYFEKDVD